MELSDAFLSGRRWVSITSAASFLETDEAEVEKRIERGELIATRFADERRVLVEVPESVESEEMGDSGSWWTEGNDACTVTTAGKRVTAGFVTDWLHDQEALQSSFDEIKDKIEHDEFDSVTFDFEVVHNVSATAIGMLAEVARMVKSKAGETRVINCSPWVVDSLRVAQLHRLCEIEPVES